MFIESEQLRAAVLIARAAALNAEVEGMKAENVHRVACGNAIMYGEDAFLAVIDRHGLGYNNIVMVVGHGEA